MSVSQMDEIKGLSRDQATIALAISVLTDRIARLDNEDREAVWKIARCMSECESDEDFNEASDALLEVLDQNPIRTEELELGQSDKPEGAKDELMKWKRFIGKKVSELRKERGLTQVELADLAELPQSHISRIENSRLSPSCVTIKKIADALGIDPSEIDPSYH